MNEHQRPKESLLNTWQEERSENPMNEIEPDQALQENIPNAENLRTTQCTKTPWSPFEQVTALRGQSISRSQGPKSTRRRRTRLDIFDKDVAIPHVKYDATPRDRACSLMERQDRINREIFSKLNDLAQRVEDLELERQEDKGAK
jgi:hypothetical protein